MRFLPAAFAAILACSPLCSPAFAAPQAAPAPATAPATVDAPAVVAEVRRIIAERYVLPERRPALDAVLAEGLASGRYAVSSPNELAERINADLDRVGHDRHLNFHYDPRQAAELTAIGPEGPGGGGDASEFERQIRAVNHGITELRILPGNVRLMRYDGFQDIGDVTDQAIADAARFLSGGDAVIIDLRTNGGGSPRAVQQLISRFLAAGTPLVTFYMNGEADPNAVTALPDPLIGRMVGKPLYVLTSGGTASAAEEFTGHVLGYHLGEVIGANTAGAGFRNATLPVGGQFVFSVSIGRAVLASTGKDWEAVGHAPTFPTPVPAALDVAQVHALRALAGKASGEDRTRLEAMADAVDARMTPRTAARPLTAYAGLYGERAIRVDAAGLTYQRADRAPVRLLALGGDRFVLASDLTTQLVFEASANAIDALTFGQAGGPSPTRYARSGD
jgi:hypothetical protein